MKTKLLVFFMCLFFLVLGMAHLSAQVVTGLNEAPEKYATLQIKDKSLDRVNDPLDGVTAEKGGLLLPRVKLVKKKELLPFVTQEEVNANSQEYKDAKKLHAGLIVYNLVEDDDEELCLGLNQWDGEKWNCFEQKATTAQFDFDCAKVEVLGDYGDNVALNSSNYLKVTLTVTRIGSYTISATADPDNGYFFETSGVFFSPGTYSITIPGTGMPVNHTQGTDLVNPADDTPDQFTLTSSGGGADCSFTVNVRSTTARPEFFIDCKATEVQGMYFEDEPLSTTPNPINGQSHRIKVTLKDIPSSAYGAVAILETNTVDGFSFKGEAVLMSSTQDIFLIGTGTPRNLNDKVFTITSNSVVSNASCDATVYMLIPRKRLMTLGNRTGPLFSYNAGIVDTRSVPHNLNAMLTDKNNFGYNQWSILKFSGFDNVGTATFSNFLSSGSINSWTDDNRDIIALDTDAWRAMNADKLESLLKGTNGQPKIDIFMIGYDTNFFRGVTESTLNADDKARCDKLVEFVKTGGILMICSESREANGNFMNLLFNYPSPRIGSTGGAGAGSNYTLGFNNSNMPADMRPYYCKDDDPILKGPFEDIVGRNWAEDASQTMYVTNLPLDEVVIYSGAREIGNSTRDARGVTIFRHRDYPFIFIGDGGFNSSADPLDYQVIDNICPFVLTTKIINGKTYTKYPKFRLNIGGAGNRAYNTAFTANAFAWCIYKAEEYRRANR